jgi:DNA replication initiation complex subunit (GINS family)
MAALNASNGVEPPPEMMKSEREFFSQLLVLLKEEEKTLGDAGGGVTRALSHAATMAKGNDEIGKKIGKDEEIKPITKTEETKGSEERRTEKEISVIQDIEEFVGLNGHTYGPYKSGEHVTVPAEEAEMLIKMKAAKQME